jgi:hypothetical protein
VVDNKQALLRGAHAWVIVGAVGLVAGACATTRQPRSTPEISGFLGDYSQLREGHGKEAGLIYINPEADFSEYDAVFLHSVSLWTTEETEKLSAKERQALTDYLYEAVHRELAKDYRMVQENGPGVMRLRLAITRAKGAHVITDTITSIIPQARTIATLGTLASDKALLVGKAGVEMEIQDSLTNERLVAAVDERWGTKAIRGGILKWSDVKRAFDYWAERLRVRLAEERALAK